MGVSKPELPAGRPPWDPWNGARVGIIAGGTAGVGVTLALSMTSFWLVPVGAVAGGVLGYWSEKRSQRVGHPEDGSDDGIAD